MYVYVLYKWDVSLSVALVVSSVVKLIVKVIVCNKYKHWQLHKLAAAVNPHTSVDYRSSTALSSAVTE